jgi:hypothetical protein
MSQALLIILGVYLLACYGYGMFVLYRLWSTKQVVRPVSKLDAPELVKAAKQELDQEKQRIAA